MGRTAGLAAVVFAGGSLLAACTGASEPGPTSTTQTPSLTDSPSSSPTASVSKPPTPTPSIEPIGFAPLTGKPLTDSAAVIRPIVAVAVRLGGVAPLGLGSADILVESFDRAGRSRMLALFQSSEAKTVGPVADTAPSDIRLLTPMGVPLYAYVSGPTGFVVQASAGAVTARSAITAPGLFHSANGLFTSTIALRATAPQAKAAPAGLYTFDSVPASAAKGARKVTKVSITIPGQPTQVWAWNGKIWAGPGGLSRANLVIQTVAYKTLTPSNSSPVGSPEIVGTGAVTVLANNFAVAGTWIRPQLLQVTNYVDPSGLPFSLVPGNTLVLLVPTGSKAVSS